MASVPPLPQYHPRVVEVDWAEARAAEGLEAAREEAERLVGRRRARAGGSPALGAGQYRDRLPGGLLPGFRGLGMTELEGPEGQVDQVASHVAQRAGAGRIQI